MSVQPPYSTIRSTTSDDRCRIVPNKNDPPKEDCRDYLRTGRCKYGASCKYNHPANVQSGGGMKAPIDPSEPLFPIRYNEPVCQYYMKHGTCKFGQACKFHHPPQVTGNANSINGNNPVLLGMPMAGRKDDGGSLAHSSSMWKGGNDSGGHMLPQRPDEPNCIYFLKNGRCKYGATCRYHHPLNVSRNRNGYDDVRSNNRKSQDYHNAPKVHYVTALPPGSMQQGHFVVADGTVTFLSLDGNTPAHVVSISHPTNPGNKEFINPGTVASTSSTSIASSFETSVSNVDNGEVSSQVLWNTRKINGNATNAYGLPRVVSTGSSHSENSGNIYYDSSGGPTTWRGPRSASFDHTRVRSLSNISNQEEEIRRSASVHSALDERANGRPRSASMTTPMMYGGNVIHRDASNPVTPTRAPLRPGEVDDGLSMMTSALLTMLDTPTEEGGSNQHRDQDYEIDERRTAVSTTRLDHQFYAKSNAPGRGTGGHPDDYPREYQPSNSTYFGHGQYTGQNLAGEDQLSQDSPSNSLNHAVERRVDDQSVVNQTPRIQAWQGSATAGVIHENSQFFSIDSGNEMPPSSSSNHSTNVGLYY